jgi:hypothetical protein
MWKLDDARLASVGEPVDIEARVGTGVLFNALMLHGTSNPGLLRRVSCDLRFFPLCGFLPSEVHLLGPDPWGTLGERIARANGPVLRAPLLEGLVYLGEEVALSDPPPLSPLNWVKYVAHLMRSEMEAALPYLNRFVNAELMNDPPSVLSAKFHGRPIHQDRLQAVQARLASARRT